MSFLIVNNETNYPYKKPGDYSFKSYETESRAQAMCTRLNKRMCPPWRVMSYQAWTDEFNPMVTKKNLLSGKEFQCRKYEPACTDPSTETYHSM